MAKGKKSKRNQAPGNQYLQQQQQYMGIIKLLLPRLLGSIQGRHPRLPYELISHHLNNEVFSYAQTYGGKPENFTRSFLNKFEPEDLLTEKGKEIVLSQSLLEKKSLGETVGNAFNRFFPTVQERIQIKNLRQSGAKGFLKSYIPFTAERKLLKEKYLDRTTSSFVDLYELMKTGNYAERMPELAKAVTNVYDAGFFDAATKVLYEGKLLNPWRYNMLQKQIHRRAKEGVEHTKRSLEYYVMPYKATGVVLGVIGLGSLLMNNSITGNVVGTGNPNAFGLLGGVLLVISGILLWFMKKKQVKHKTQRKKNIKKKKKR